jgi:hypothetical protein
MSNATVKSLLEAFREQNGGSCFADNEEMGDMEHGDLSNMSAGDDAGEGGLEGDYMDPKDKVLNALGQSEMDHQDIADIEGNKTHGEGPTNEIEMDFRKMLEPKSGSKYKSARMG